MNDFVEKHISSKVGIELKRTVPQKWGEEPDQIMIALYLKKSEKELKKDLSEIKGKWGYYKFLKYFVSVDKDGVDYGLCIERGDSENLMDETWDWVTFEKRFPEIFESCQKIPGIIIEHDDGRIASLDEAKTVFGKSNNSNTWINLNIFKCVQKTQAIAMSKDDWEKELTETFSALKPIYLLVKNMHS